MIPRDAITAWGVDHRWPQAYDVDAAADLVGRVLLARLDEA